MVETTSSIDYDAEKVAIDLGSYARLRKKTSLLSAQQLQQSGDYQNLLRVEQRLKKLNLSGDQLLELSDYIIDYMVVTSDIKASLPYIALKEEHDELEEKLGKTERRLKMLRGDLEKLVEPLKGVLDLGKVLEEDVERAQDQESS